MREWKDAHALLLHDGYNSSHNSSHDMPNWTGKKNVSEHCCKLKVYTDANNWVPNVL